MESIKSADIVQTAHRMPAPSDMTPSLAEQCRTNQDETEAKEQCEPGPTPGQGTEQVTVKSTSTDPAPGAVASEDNAVDSPSAGGQGGELPDTAGLEAPDKPDEARENRDPDEADADMILQDKKQEAGEEDAESSNASMTVTDDAPPLEHLVPRPYQAECIALMNAQTGGRHLIVLATGLGKTVVGAFIRKGQKVLWLSHRDELVEQPRKYFEFEGWTYGIEKAQTMSHGEDIVSASVQTLCRDDRLHRFNPDAFDTIIVDEYEIIGLNLKSQLNQGFRGLVLFLLTLKIADKAIHRRQYAQNRNLSAERGAASLCSASTRHTLPTYISFRRSTELSACVDLHRVPLRHSTHVPVARAA